MADVKRQRSEQERQSTEERENKEIRGNGRQNTSNKLEKIKKGQDYL